MRKSRSKSAVIVKKGERKCHWAVGAAPETWPKESRIHQNGRFKLVVFAHPMCPCTRASLAELARLLAVCDDQVETHVVLIEPDGTDASWRDSDLVRQARQIPGVEVLLDANRHEANLFHARTSGCCLLYDPAGKLAFQGGLTVARGHEGDSDGSRTVLALLGGNNAAMAGSPVFGCPLFESETSSSRIASPAN
jgi:hypothetical protein